jgi:enhancing lycopene biosynthesis protein 2
MQKIGVILSGCGVNDGSEIHEAVLTLLAIDKAGAQAVCMAPDMPQADVVDHLSGTPTQEKRRVLAESARIARGEIQDIRRTRASELDAVILPGGYGAAKNLSTFAKDGPGCSVQEDVARLLREMHQAGKPIGALCIAPAVLAKVFGASKPELTIGKDPGAAEALQAMGARHQERGASEVAVDRTHKLVTTPAYMLAGRISEVAAGADALVRAVLELSKTQARA